MPPEKCAYALARYSRSGKLDPGFGEGGVRNLRTEFEPKFAALTYGPTSAPAIWNDTIILGNSSGEGPGIAAPGDIRAFDVRTGKEVWRFRTVPRSGEFGNETWRSERLGRIQRRRGPGTRLRRARLGCLRLLRRRQAR